MMHFKINIIAILSFIIFLNFSADRQLLLKSYNINFSVKNAGITVKGTFTNPIGQIKYNAANELLSINETVKLETISTGIKRRDHHLLSADYFSATLLPEIKFETTKISKKDLNNNYRALVKITIKNTTKIIDIIINETSLNNTITLTSNFKLNRIDFGVGGKSFTMDNEVIVNVSCSGIIGS